MAMAAVLLIVSLLAAPAVYATDYTVGDATGWDQTGDYATWASGKTFKVGDNLIFNYGPSHSVNQVNQPDYSTCTTGKAIQSYNGGQSTVPLKTAGPMYFICPTIGHCAGGMKLSITVAAASGTPATPATPATPSPPSTSTPPKSGTPPSTPTPSKDTPSTNSARDTNMNLSVLGMSFISALVAFMG